MAYLRLSSHLKQLPAECGAWYSVSTLGLGVFQYGIDFPDFHFDAPNETEGEPAVSGLASCISLLDYLSAWLSLCYFTTCLVSTQFRNILLTMPSS